MFPRVCLVIAGCLGVAVPTGCERTAVRNDSQPPRVEEFSATGYAATFPMPVPPPPPPLPSERVLAEPDTKPNALAKLADNDFDSWTLSPRLHVESPMNREQINAIVPANATVTEPTKSDTPDLTAFLADARSRFERVPDFAARLTKREVVGDKQMPTEEAEYKFRQHPFSVYLRVTSDAGRGREILYVRGRDDAGLHLVTGKGDHLLTGVKTVIALTDPRLTKKSRYRADEAGFGRTLAGLAKAVEAGNARLVGPVSRPEYPVPLTAVEVTFPPRTDPLFPAGGTRQIFFDPRPDSPSFRLPVLVVTHEPGGREVEYYLFDRIRLPAGLTDADFDPARLGK